MKESKQLLVKYHGTVVGILAETRAGYGVFQYDKEWIEKGYSISPFSLPLLVQDGLLELSIGVERAGMSVEEFKKALGQA